MTAIQRVQTPILTAAGCLLAINTGLSAQQAVTPQAPAQQGPQTTRPTQPVAATPSTSRSQATGPQGFSIVLVLGDIQATSPSDDVPPAARKALTDMRDFLPYKSYRLLDAAWLLCCGQHARRGTPRPAPSPSESITQMLRGPEGQEYELKLWTSQTDNARVFVRFALFGGADTPPAEGSSNAAVERALATEVQRLELAKKMLADVRGKVEVGTASPSDVMKAEIEVKDVERRINDLRMRVERGGPRAQFARSATIDTSFTMDVGETVVVGTSRMKGGTKALIALLTAVPPRVSTGARE